MATSSGPESTVTGPSVTGSRAESARRRVRAELTTELKAIARRHLAVDGSSALSLRAVAREAGMVSSAIYRYFPSRDDLLTALIVDAYDAVGDAAERADAQAPAGDTIERWMAVASSIRRWARANPHEYALVYGSPVPGYAAPIDTVDPASRVGLVLLQILGDGADSGEIGSGSSDDIPPATTSDFERLMAATGRTIPGPVVARGFAVWVQLFGSISFELFGHFHNVIHDDDAFFEMQMRNAGEWLLGGVAS